MIEYGFSLFSDYDIYLFRKGSHTRLYKKFGCHLFESGAYFALWAPNAREVYVFGDFNGWDKFSLPLKKREDGSGIWEGFVKGVKEFDKYKFYIKGGWGYEGERADPFGFWHEGPPGNASLVKSLSYSWQDSDWMEKRAFKNLREEPLSIYEVHLGSWKRQNGRFLNYRELAIELASYLKDMGFTHIELMPVMEHPFYGSWGYQITGYFAPTSRYGTPQDFMFFVDYMHKEGIGVILDWVPSHFATDMHALAFFDGGCLYEYLDWRKGWHPDWKSLVFDYGRAEVRSFLLSSAHFWLDVYHIDALRVDAVASMLYLDYSRKEWIPNVFGGKENLEAIEFIKELNESVYKDFKGIETIAEESTAFPMVSRPVYLGGLGFGFKWNMGWMHDTLRYFSRDPIYRKYHQNEITFSIWYAFYENFILPLSHDEVVHGKGSLISKMPGDYWQKFANLRLLYTYMWTHPGKKLLFMGGEIAQFDEWNHENSIQWHLLEFDMHRGIKRLVKDLNMLYCSYRAFYELDCESEGFEWVDFADVDSSIVSYLRRSKDGSLALVVLNFTPVPRFNYKVGVPKGGEWIEVFNSDSEHYGGTNLGNFGKVLAIDESWHYRDHHLVLTLPPLAGVVLIPKDAQAHAFSKSQ
ncbi:MAG: 1,4-alpha-glucan branching protein GlgB [Aquificaceae bacterium]